MNTTLIVTGMHCKSCEMLIKEELEEQRGVRSVSASVAKGSVTITFDEKTIALSEIKKILKKEGYPAQ